MQADTDKRVVAFVKDEAGHVLFFQLAPAAEASRADVGLVAVGGGDRLQAREDGGG